jgi:exodeoxyribonuclease VII small subunit
MEKNKLDLTTPTYAQALQEVQTIVQSLQEGQIGIDELSEQLSRAAKLIKFCREKLRQTEQEVDGLFALEG